MPNEPVHLKSQVGGHAGRMLTSEDGSLLFKPTTPTEHAFYESVSSDPAHAALLPFLPKFLGKLKLQGQQDPLTGGLIPSDVPEEVSGSYSV